MKYIAITDFPYDDPQGGWTTETDAGGVEKGLIYNGTYRNTVLVAYKNENDGAGYANLVVYNGWHPLQKDVDA